MNDTMFDTDLDMEVEKILAEFRVTRDHTQSNETDQPAGLYDSDFSVEEKVPVDIEYLHIDIPHEKAGLLNLEPVAESETPQEIGESQNSKKDAAEKKKPLAVRIISNVIFFAVFAAIILGAISFAQSDDTHKSIFGYRPYYVKSESMKRVYPKGSVVFVKLTDPSELHVDDDIAFYLDEKATEICTHRIIEVKGKNENGELEFQTKGVENPAPDPFVVTGQAVVGKINFSIPWVGAVMVLLTENVPVVVIMGFFFIGMLWFLSRYFKLRRTGIIKTNKVKYAK